MVLSLGPIALKLWHLVSGQDCWTLISWWTNLKRKQKAVVYEATNDNNVLITVVNNIKFLSISSLVPNEAPVILELNSPTSTTIHLKWSEVTQLNSVPLLGYVIIFKENITRFQPDIQKSVLPLPQETVLEDLKKFTHYTIRVYAFTRNGNGIPSKALTLRTEEDGKYIMRKWKGPFLFNVRSMKVENMPHRVLKGRRKKY